MQDAVSSEGTLVEETEKLTIVEDDVSSYDNNLTTVPITK